MDIIEARGVVKSGQVILDDPLNVPDGTEVHVEAYSAEDQPFDPRKTELVRKAVLGWIQDPELRRKFETEFPVREAS